MGREPGRAAVTVMGWLLTRGLVLVLYVGPQHWVTGDVAYFTDSLSSLARQGLGGTLPEYPLAGVAVLAVPWLLAQALGGGLTATAWLLLVLALVADAAFTVLMYRSTSRSAALAVWLLGIPLLGATAYARFDIVPGVLAGAAVLLLVRRPRLAALAAAVGAAVKLWPALLVPALAGRPASRGPVIRLVLAVGAVVVGGTLVLAGWARLVSPLAFQSGRGMQIESVPAAPAMVGWILQPGDYAVSYAATHAFEVSGPGVATLVDVSTVLTVAVAVFLAALWWRMWRTGAGPEAVGWASLAAVTGFVVTSRVLSPQYLLWLLPVAAAVVATAGPRRSAQLRWAVLLLVAAGLTQLEFPVLYGDLVGRHPGSAWAVTVLVARNLLLVWLAADAAVRAWLSSAQRGSELARQAPGPERTGVRSLR